MSDDGSPFLFRRPSVAWRIADGLMGRGAFHYGSGLFLAAPRRTGKSTFMREDLIPMLTERGVLTTYVDLWADRQKDPGILISDAVKATLKGLDNWGVKTVRKSRLAKLSIAGAVTFDVDKIGQPDGATLTDVFKAIVERTGKPTALIVDEAQQALATAGGVNAMFALKAARDALNQGGGGGLPDGTALLLVFTGSHRDKLSNFVLKRDQPFFGADIADFPRLGRDYTDAYADWINERIWEDYDSEFSLLTTMRKAVLRRLVHEGARFAPFTSASLAAYTAAAKKHVTTAEAQAALDAPRQKNIVWRNARAAYTLEDQDMAEWFLARHGDGETEAPSPRRVSSRQERQGGVAGPVLFGGRGNHSPLGSLNPRRQQRRDVMDKDRIEGAMDKVKGSVKEAAGKVTGDAKLQAEGKAQKAAGHVESAVGGAKDAVRDALHKS